MSPAAATTFTYSPLDRDRNEIRLLRLLPSTDSTSPVLCELKHDTLNEDAYYFYEALSYTWGNNAKKVSIILDDVTFSVTSNLFAALRTLRNQDSDRYLWIDAICINQQDIPERNQEVLRMIMIFNRARRVVVWLGEASADSALAMSHLSDLSYEWFLDHDKGCLTRMFRVFIAVFLRASFFITSAVAVARVRPFATSWIVAYYVRRILWGNTSTGYIFMALKIFTVCTILGLLYALVNTYLLMGRMYQDQKYMPDAVTVKALQGIFSRHWFRRVWIVQEIAVAREAIVVCGPDVMSWWEFNQGCRQITRRVRQTSTRNPYNDTNFVHCARIGRLLDINNISETKVRLKRNLLFLLQHFGHLDATDPRDKVYGLLGLASEVQEPDAQDEMIVPDYNHPTSMVYADLVKFMVTKTRRLDILRACQGSSRRISDLPSWAPDWTGCTNVNRMDRFTQVNYFDLSSHLEVAAARFSDGLVTMTVQGFVVGKLADSGKISFRSDNAVDIASQLQDLPINVDLLLKCLLWLIKSRTLGFGLKMALWLFVKFYPEAQTKIVPFYEMVDKLMEDIKMTQSAGNSEGDDEKPDLPITFENAFDTGNSFPREENPVRSAGWQSLLQTTTMDPGICHFYASDPQAGDLVCMFIGAGEPHLARKLEDGYSLVGPATFDTFDHFLWRDCVREYEEGTLVLQDFEIR